MLLHSQTFGTRFFSCRLLPTLVSLSRDRQRSLKRQNGNRRGSEAPVSDPVLLNAIEWMMLNILSSGS